MQGGYTDSSVWALMYVSNCDASVTSVIEKRASHSVLLTQTHNGILCRVTHPTTSLVLENHTDHM